MLGLTNFEPYMRGERSGQAETRTKNADNERIAGPDDFDLAADTDPEGLKMRHFLTAGFDVADHRAGVRREFIQPLRGG